MTKETLLEKLDEVIKTGDEKALEMFVIEHFTELPEDVRGKVLLSFYAESLEKEANEAAIAELQEIGIATMNKLSGMASTDETTK